MDSHNGLRGAASIWIALFHAIQFSEIGMDFNGSSIMPLFFMLSGFSLTVAYGHKFPDPSNAIEVQKPFAKKPYYWNRWIRTMPTYYLVNALAFVPAWFGFTGLPPFRLQGV